MTFKIVHHKEIHLLNKEVTLQELTAFIQKSFTKLPQNYIIYYLDSEGDKIRIVDENDLAILY